MQYYYSKMKKNNLEHNAISLSANDSSIKQSLKLDRFSLSSG